MSIITTSSLAQFIQKQLDLYFTDFHKAELEKKILEMTTAVEHMIPEIIKIDPSQKNKFDKWRQDLSILEKTLFHLEELKQKSSCKTSEIDNIIFCLKTVLSDCEILFPSKTIAMTDWNIYKGYLNDKIHLLKEEDCNRMLTCDEIISFLNLAPLSQCTSELGHYKEFARGIDGSGKTFTKIFYLLKNYEKSYFHKLDTTETWVWLGKYPLSLFIMENGHMNENVLSESNQSIIVPCQTWFGATVKNSDKHNQAEDDIPFALVTCHCMPAFTLNSFHDDITKSEEASMSLLNAYKKAVSQKQTDIIELLVPQYQEEFKKRITQAK